MIFFLSESLFIIIVLIFKGALRAVSCCLEDQSVIVVVTCYQVLIPDEMCNDNLTRGSQRLVPIHWAKGFSSSCWWTLVPQLLGRNEDIIMTCR